MTEETGLPGPIRAAIRDPDEGRRRLSAVVDLLDDDDPATRIAAAWAVSLVARDRPDAVPDLVRALEERLREEPSPAVSLALADVTDVDPETAAAELAAIERGDDASARPAPGDAERIAGVGGPQAGDDPATDRGSDADRVGGEGDRAVASDDGPGSVDARTDHDRDREGPGDHGSADHGPADRGRTDHEPADHGRADRGPTGSDPGRTGPSGGGPVETGVRDRSTARGARDGSDDGSVRGEPRDGAESRRDALTRATRRLSTVAAESGFDRLVALSRRRRGRYADRYRTLGAVDGGEVPVDVALYHRPSGDDGAHVADLRERLTAWRSAGDHRNVVTVYDHGVRPGPWSVTEFAELSLADRNRLSPADAAWNARGLAAGLAHLHERGVVHGGIDPRSVVYYGDAVADDERRQPLLSDVGVLAALRRHLDPTGRLDPRYAAPEYYDRTFGRIDGATDVYALGAVVYRLFTGRPPYTGDYAEVRSAVLGAPPPRPSDVADVPPAVDAVVEKAMAAGKLARYESAAGLLADLREVTDG